jgi:hypothetical protein
MSRTGPRDLAVAFRSLARRLHEALGDSEDTGANGSGAAAELRSIVAAAAVDLGVPAEGDLAAMGEAVATAIEHTPADAWDTARLDRLRDLTQRAGSVLRAAAAEAGVDPGA